MVNYLLKKSIEYGLDVFMVSFIINFLSTDSNGFYFVFTYMFFRSFYIKSILITMYTNFFLLLLAGVFSTFTPILNENQIYILLLFSMVALVMGIMISFNCIYKLLSRNMLSSTLEIDPKSFFKKIIDCVENIIRGVFAIIYPCIIIFMVIMCFAGIYNSANYYYDINEFEGNIGITEVSSNQRLTGLKLEEKSVSNWFQLKELIGSGYMYFSSVTFFTIGYGDLIPKGSLIRNITNIEMIIAHILTITYFALYSSRFYEFLKKMNNDLKTSTNTPVSDIPL